MARALAHDHAPEGRANMPRLDFFALAGLMLSPLVGALASAPAYGQAVDVQRLSDRVLIANVPVLGPRNVVAVSAKRGLVLIETGVSPSLMGRMKEEIERQFVRHDWAYVINTHGHPDGHVGGNALFARNQGLSLEQAQAQLALDQRFPYMRDVQARQGSQEGLHPANVAAVWKLLAQQ
jgi:glyoxylase-like metal-dependent hydrolase (beta-lactamase superfamily II)